MKLVLPQPQASALVHGLFSMWVLDADDPMVTGVCATCEGTGAVESPPSYYSDQLHADLDHCSDCDAGRVPRLEPGCRVTIASNRERPSTYRPPKGGWMVRDYDGRGPLLLPVGATWPNDRGLGIRLPLNSVVGSEVVEAVAPIVTDTSAVMVKGSACLMSVKTAWMRPHRTGRDDNGYWWISHNDQEWLPSDLTGMVAVLLRDVEPCEPRPT